MKPTIEECLQAVKVMSLVIPFFPRRDGDDGIATHNIIAAEVQRFVANQEQLAWLTETACRFMREWKGIPELRGLFCTKYDPADGVACDSTLPGFTEADLENRWRQKELEERERKACEIDAAKRIAPPGDLEPFALPDVKRLPAAPPVKTRMAELEREMQEAPRATAARTLEERLQIVQEVEHALSLQEALAQQTEDLL